MISRISRLLANRRTEAYFLGVVAFIVPLIILSVLGIFTLVGLGLFIPLLLISSIFLFSIALIFTLRRKKKAIAEEPVQDPMPREDWSSKDDRIWKLALERVNSGQLYKIEWSRMSNAMMDQLSFVALHYHGEGIDAEYKTTFPELLLMIEICAREYRALVLGNVPFSQDIKLSHIKLLYDNKENIELGRKISLFAWRFIRAIKDPVGSIAKELSSAANNSSLSGIADHMENNLKRMLLQEVIRVAIDLYSGRLRLSDEELGSYQSEMADAVELTNARPLTIAVIGQVNSGKSSLINSLAGKCISGADVIPCSDRVTRHRLKLREEIEVDLLDTPGIDGDQATSKILLDTSTNADLVLWLSQANQPAKALDAELIIKWKEYFVAHTERRVPPLILVTTHNDLLARDEGWNPPYDLNDDDDPKVKIMLEAVKYTCESLGLDADYSVVPICLAPDKDEYNLQTLLDCIIGISEEARASQLNRDRIEGVANQSVVEKVWKPLMGMGKVAGKVLLSSS